MQLWLNNQQLKLMLRKLALTILPLTRSVRVSLIRNTNFQFAVLKQKNYFTTQKKDDLKNKQAGKSQAAQSQETSKTEKKLSQLTNEELIELNTQDSIKLVRSNIKKMEQLRAKQQQQVKELSQKMQSMNKHHNEAATKQELLLENIKLQEEELIRIKKRADKQIQDSKDFAISKLAKELLQFADSLKRCKIMAEQKAKTGQMDEYSKRIIDLHQQFQTFLKLYDIEEFDPTNQPFDPNTAEGLVTIPTPPGYVKNNVATTMMTGYKIKSRLLRSAKVGIFV